MDDQTQNPQPVVDPTQAPVQVPTEPEEPVVPPAPVEPVVPPADPTAVPPVMPTPEEPVAPVAEPTVVPEPGAPTGGPTL